MHCLLVYTIICWYRFGSTLSTVVLRKGYILLGKAIQPSSISPDLSGTTRPKTVMVWMITQESELVVLALSRTYYLAPLSSIETCFLFSSSHGRCIQYSRSNGTITVALFNS
jgi:hypothetical protein